MNERSSKLRTLYLNGNVTIYNNQNLRKLAYATWMQTTGENIVPFPLDANRLTGFAWYIDGAKWRLDASRVYPTLGNDFSQSAYNGEKYIGYDEYGAYGKIAAESSIHPILDGWTSQDFTTFSADGVFGGGWLQAIRDQYLEKGDNFESKGQTQMSGQTVNFYVYSKVVDGGQMDVKIWYDNVHQVPLRIEASGVNQEKKIGNAKVYVASNIVKAGDIFVPTSVKIEKYAVDSGKNIWLNSMIYATDEISVNDKSSVDAFSHPIRVTAQVEDSLNNPGVYHIIGGVSTDDILKVREGTPPKLELDAIANGTSGEVESEQRKQEDKFNK